MLKHLQHPNEEQCNVLTLRSGKHVNQYDKFRGEHLNNPRHGITQPEDRVEDVEREKAPEEKERTEGSERHRTNNEKFMVKARDFLAILEDNVRPSPPFPQRLKKHDDDIQFKKLIDVLDQLSEDEEPFGPEVMDVIKKHNWEKCAHHPKSVAPAMEGQGNTEEFLSSSSFSTSESSQDGPPNFFPNEAFTPASKQPEHGPIQSPVSQAILVPAADSSPVPVSAQPTPTTE
ncbi:uncharacterized protein LOC120124770 [Hibiscus syriacus]|uniref:uncharacterized protein LOC120124770 n=1 Tax=Hibiscus syriacus TaxID=106335 RepID=UPI0019223F03|nr:uncharacterized protein LOC120124770 [Hibiscus syriacus]